MKLKGEVEATEEKKMKAIEVKKTEWWEKNQEKRMLLEEGSGKLVEQPN